LLVPPGYDGPLPEGGLYVAHSRTNRTLVLGRSFMENDDPAPTVATIKSRLRLYPYTPGGAGTSIATLLEGKVPPPGPGTDVPETKFVEATRISLSLRVIDEGSRPGSDAGYRGGCDVEGCAHPS
jgi:hypothetical protein